MTTNQTIDGVPREQMISFPRELNDEMAEILAEKARVCGAGAFDIWELLCARFGTETASQPQREPVAWMRPSQGGMCISNEVKQHSIKLGGAPASAVAGYSIPLHAEQPEPVAVVLDEKDEFVTWVRREWPQAPLSNVRDLLPKDDPRYGEYCDEALQRAWVGWQARSAVNAKP